MYELGYPRNEATNITKNVSACSSAEGYLSASYHAQIDLRERIVRNDIHKGFCNCWNVLQSCSGDAHTLRATPLGGEAALRPPGLTG
jgi:hypothetical protein